MYRKGMKAKVLATVAARPEWSAPEIAAYIDACEEYVRTCCRRNGIVLPSAKGSRIRLIRKIEALEAENAKLRKELDECRNWFK